MYIYDNKKNTFNDLSLKTNYNTGTLNKEKNLKTLNIFEKEEINNLIYYPSASKEWFSNVYTFNKSYIKTLIALNLTSNNLFSSYFNISINYIKTLFKRRRHNKSRYSANKVYVSRAEFKHTNTKIFIILSTYNKQKSKLLRSTRKIIFFKRVYRILVERANKFWVKPVSSVKTIFKNMIDKSRINVAEVVEKTNIILERYIPAYVNRLTHKWNNLFNGKFFLFKKWNMPFLKKNNNNILTNFLLKFNNLIYKGASFSKFISKITSRAHIKLFNNTRLISFNKSKFNHLVLNLRNLGLTSLLEKIYNKKVEIKLVDLKSIHLNSDVFSSAVALKLRDRQNKAVRVLRKAILQMVRIPDLHTLITFDDSSQTMNKNNILNTIKQQIVSGIRFETAGRLTRRLTAMRSVFKYRYTGSLKNIRSSFNNKAAILLRGHAKANSQYTLINSKTRNGTFGLKGWMSTH